MPRGGLVFHSDQLRGDPNPVVFAPDAAFQNVVNARLGPDLSDALAGALVRHAGSSSDHPHVLGSNAPKVADRLFRQAVAEVLLVGIVGRFSNGNTASMTRDSGCSEVRGANPGSVLLGSVLAEVIVAMKR